MFRRLIYTLMVLLAVLGIISLVIRFTEGTKVTALTSSVPWGMWVVFYIYFVGLSAGSFLISTLVYVFGLNKLKDIGPLSFLCAIIALLAGMVFIWIDLGHPFRFWKVLVNFNYTSILAWETMFYTLYILLLFICFWFLKRCDFADMSNTTVGKRKILFDILSLGFKCPTTKAEYNVCHEYSLKIVRYLSIIGIPVVISVRGGTGALFAVVAARPHWFSGLLPIIFLVSGLLSSCAMLLFIYNIFADKKNGGSSSVIQYLRNLLLLFLSIELLLFTSEFLVGMYSKIPERLELYQKVLFGPFPYIFWIGQVFLGIMVPLFLCIYKKTKNSSFWLSIAGFSCSCGVVSIILNLVIPVYVFPMLEGLDKAFIDKRLNYYYFPSLIEWTSTFGFISLISLVFIFLIKYLPIFPRLEKKFNKGVE